MTGWMRPILPVSLLLLASAASIQGAEQATPTADEDEEFLLFLADWEDEQGDWQDPLDYDDAAWMGMDTGQDLDEEETSND